LVLAELVVHQILKYLVLMELILYSVLLLLL
jgi:hypothetical protein